MSTDKPHLIRIDNQDIRVLDRKVVLGRHPGCDYVISLNDRNIGISGRHAAVEAQGDVAWLEDLGSTNGTWVLGERIAKRTQLAPGDRFQLDRLEFEFRAAVKPAPPPPLRTTTTISIGIEELALPAPAPMQPPPKSQPKAAPPPPPPSPPPAPAKPEPVVAPPPPPPPPPPVQPVPPPAPEPVPPVVVKPPAVEATPVQPVVVPATVEVKVVEAKAPPAAAPVPPKEEPVIAPPPPKAESVKAESPKPAAREAAVPAAENKSATKPQKVAGAWISAEHSGKTKVLLPGERDRLKEQMGSGLYASAEVISVPTLLFAPEGRRVTLAQRDAATQEWTIGSNADADVSIPEDGLSGLHAKILRNGRTWTISDLMSANGTFVNGQKINRSHLESGDQLGFGPVLCTFLLPEGAAAPRSAPTPATKKKSALPWPLLLGGAVVALTLIGAVIYLLLR